MIIIKYTQYTIDQQSLDPELAKKVFRKHFAELLRLLSRPIVNIYILRIAAQLYTEGLQLNCKDNRLTARLYNNRAAAHFRLGMEFQRSIIYSLLKSSSSKSHVVPFYANFSDRLSITPNELKDIQ